MSMQACYLWGNWLPREAETEALHQVPEGPGPQAEGAVSGRMKSNQMRCREGLALISELGTERQYDSSRLMYQWSKMPWRWAFFLLMDTLGRKMNGPKPDTSKFMLEIRRFVTIGEVMF